MTSKPEDTTKEEVAAAEEITEIKHILKEGVPVPKSRLDSSSDVRGFLMTDAEGREFGPVERVHQIPARGLILLEGYPVENYYVTTSDGYVLSIIRIPSGKDQPSNGKVVYLQHGLMGASTDWLLFGKKRGLAYILADKGFDVWLGNNRGNYSSRKHMRLNPQKDAEFWDFSWHEIGNIDIPAMIDFILAKTGKEKLYHVGYSQGTTSFYVMATTKPEYNDKIIHHISLAPIAFTSNIFSPLIRLLAFRTLPKKLGVKCLGYNEFLPTEELLTFLANTTCSEEMAKVVCQNALFAVCGFNPKQINASELSLISAHYPAGAATKQLIHYAQGCKSREFSHYDHGFFKNSTRYRSFNSPNYDLSKITAPMTIIYSQNDWLSTPKDIERLSMEVTNLKDTYLVPDPLWNHLDYIFGNDAPRIVYTKVVDVLMNN